MFPQLISTACLFLASKVEESPKPLRQVIIEVERVRHAKNIQVGGGGTRETRETV